MSVVAVRYRLTNLYDGLTGQPKTVAKWCSLLSVACIICIAILGPILGNALWAPFDHLTAVFGFVGFLIAVTAFSFAVHTDVGVWRPLSLTGSGEVSDEERTVRFAERPKEVSEPPDSEPTLADSVALERALLDGGWPKEDVAGALQRHALEKAIEAGAGGSPIRKLLRQADVFVLELEPK